MDGRKKLIAVCMLSAVLALGGCGRTGENSPVGTPGTGPGEGTEDSRHGADAAQEGLELEESRYGAGTAPGGLESEGLPTSEPEEILVTQGGPYGEISLRLPAGWDYELCPIDSPRLRTCLYGIQFYPESAEEGFIEAGYVDGFGVCGTGLSQTKRTLAGREASVGTYDGHAYWDFVFMTEGQEGLAAFTFSVGNWWEEYGEETYAVLDTISFDPDTKEGGVCLYGEDCTAEEIGLKLSLKDITSSGATLVFLLYDAQAPQGELVWGEVFSLEVFGEEGWESVQPLPGNFAFNSIGYELSPKTARETAAGNYLLEQEVGWEWMYGKLPPGTYRLGKSVSEQRAEGRKDYMLYAEFLLN